MEGILSPDHYIEFWVYWTGGIIEIGQGAIPLAFPIASYEDPAPLNIEFMAFSTGNGSEGYWKVDALMSK